MVNGVDGGKRYVTLSCLRETDRSVLPFVLRILDNQEGEWENVAKFWAEDGARLRLAEFSARRRLQDNREWWWIIVER